MGLLLLILAFTGFPAAAQAPPTAEADLQYDLLLQDLGRREAIATLGPQVLHPAALIQATDRDPLDIVLRARTPFCRISSRTPHPN